MRLRSVSGTVVGRTIENSPHFIEDDDGRLSLVTDRPGPMVCSVVVYSPFGCNMVAIHIAGTERTLILRTPDKRLSVVTLFNRVESAIVSGALFSNGLTVTADHFRKVVREAA